MKYILSIIIIASAFFTAAQNSNPSLIKMSEILNKGKTDFPKNKVFIKTDKDIYSPGEKIWFKAEVFNCLSEIYSDETELIVMLKAESGEVIFDNKYLIINGVCDNQITIPSWAKQGNAFIVAYTPKALKTNDASLAAIKPLTLNSYKKSDYLLKTDISNKIYKPGEEIRLNLIINSISPGNKKEKVIISLFDFNQKVLSQKFILPVNEISEVKFKLPEKINNGLFIDISIQGNDNATQKIPIFTIEDKIKVEFFPEGGTLLTNQLQRILYRATNPLNEPVEISGKVYDQFNNQVGYGKIMKKGYGLINIMPLPGQKYFFKVEDEYGKDQEFELPEALIDGSVFSLLKTEDSTLRVSIFTSGKYVGEELTLAAVTGGEIKMAYQIPGDKKYNLKISTRELPSGIVDFLIFSKEGTLLSERLVYNTPNEDLNFDIETHLKPSATNGDVDITIDMSNFTSKFGPSSVDVKVVDKFNLYSIVVNTQQSFLKYPLYTPVPKTVLDIYLTNLELIANGYKHYSIQELLSGKDYYKPETDRAFSGIVTGRNHQPVEGATVMAVQANNHTLATTTTDDKGRFSFERLPKSNDIIVKAFSNSGKKSYNVQLNRTFNESLDELLMFESLKNHPLFDKEEILSYYQNNKDLLKLIGTENRDNKISGPSGTEKLLQSGNSVLEVIKMTKPFRIESNQIVFYGSNNSFNFQSGALIVIDGQKMGTDINVLNALSPFDVKSINISTNPVDIQKYTGLNSVGVIEIVTKKEVSDFQAPKTEKGFSSIESFDYENFKHNVWVYQTTLFWKNNIPVDKDGKVVLKIKASEIKSDFVIQVEATSQKGIKHSEISTFSTVR
ncbi:MAG: carboxypeptidase regulatory-like domain-containing protein [Prolixibacteraceae bacterium]|nr:carboxypeptidase regulatory-like domain-containing protein [Prolixibacteraceae bacterium]